MLDKDHRDDDKEFGKSEERGSPERQINPARLNRIVLIGTKQASYLLGYTRQHLLRMESDPKSDIPYRLHVGPHKVAYNAEDVADFIVRKAEARLNARPLPLHFTDKAVDVMQRLEELRLVPWREVERIFPYTRQHVRRKMRTDPVFPKQVQVGPNRVSWLSGELKLWLLALEAATRAKGE